MNIPYLKQKNLSNRIFSCPITFEYVLPSAKKCLLSLWDVLEPCLLQFFEYYPHIKLFLNK